MTQSIINELLTRVSHDLGESDVKRQKILKCVVTGNSKQYLRKDCMEEQVNKLSSKEVDTLFNIYEVKLSGQMVKSLGKSIIKMYSMGTCAIFGITNQDALSKNLESDPYKLSSPEVYVLAVLQIRFIPSPLSIGLITSRNYLSELGIKMEEQMETTNLMSEQLPSLLQV